MKNLNSIRNTFVRQSSESDCGPACLAMVLLYAGRKGEAASLVREIMVTESGLSLLEMKKLAGSFSFNARCVSMDLFTLRRSSTPSILHINKEDGQPHFLVCYGGAKKYRGWRYFVADPARKMHFISEEELVNAWKSKAALYFDDIPFRHTPLGERAWMPLLSIRSFPKALWFSIPFLNICITLMGIALSWVLQRGIDDSLTGKSKSLIISMLLLLLIITTFKSIVSYTKHRVLIKLNNEVNEQYLTSFLRALVHSVELKNNNITERTLRNNLKDIQKIQSAVSGFASVMLSEGCLILLIISGVFYTDLFIGLINTGYLAAMFIVGIKNSPELSYQTACLNELSGKAEKQLFSELEGSFAGSSAETRFGIHQQNHLLFLACAKRIATRIGKYNLFYECCGTLNVFIAFSLCLMKLEKSEISYGILMLLVISSYFISSLVQKICNALVVVAEGADASRQFKMSTSQEYK